MVSIEVQADEKLHTACDECRTRKLKCSGEKPACSRCRKEKIQCIFSPRKQMGRPRKRRREGDAESDENAATATDANGDPVLDIDMSAFQGLNATMPPQFDDSMHPLGTFESQPVSQSHDHSTAIDFTSANATDFHVSSPPIDPSLWDSTNTTVTPLESGDDQLTMAPCTCLPSMYLTLSELQSLQTFAFPQVIIPLRKAMGVLSDLIHCPQCPKDTFSATQNTSSISSLSKAIVERFGQVLMRIDAEAELLERNGEKKLYRVGDANPELLHLHTGSWDCPMGFNIELGAKDWKRMVKTVLRSEVFGKGSNARPLMMLVQEAEDRQRKWHEDPQYYCKEREYLFGDRDANAKRKCEALGADHIRRMIGSLKWE